MNIITLDISKAQTGVYTRTQGQEDFFTINTKAAKSQGQALVIFFCQLLETLERRKPDIAIIEGYSYASMNIVIEAEFVGIAKMLLAEREIPFILIAPMTWKANTIGNLKKSETKISKKTKKKYQARTKESEKAYLNAVFAFCNIQFEDTDTADAYLMYCAFKNILKKTVRLTAAERKIKDQYIKYKDEK